MTKEVKKTFKDFKPCRGHYVVEALILEKKPTKSGLVLPDSTSVTNPGTSMYDIYEEWPLQGIIRYVGARYPEYTQEYEVGDKVYIKYQIMDKKLIPVGDILLINKETLIMLRETDIYGKVIEE